MDIVKIKILKAGMKQGWEVGSIQEVKKEEADALCTPRQYHTVACRADDVKEPEPETVADAIRMKKKNIVQTPIEEMNAEIPGKKKKK